MAFRSFILKVLRAHKLCRIFRPILLLRSHRVVRNYSRLEEMSISRSNYCGLFRDCWFPRMQGSIRTNQKSACTSPVTLTHVTATTKIEKCDGRMKNEAFTTTTFPYRLRNEQQHQLTSTRMPRRGRKRKKTRTHTTESETAASSLESATKIPKSLVVSCREVVQFTGRQICTM